MSDFIETPTIGEILSEEFLIPLGISAYKLAQEINVPTSRIQDILHNRRKITVDTSLRCICIKNCHNKGYDLRSIR